MRASTCLHTESCWFTKQAWQHLYLLSIKSSTWISQRGVKRIYYSNSLCLCEICVWTVWWTVWVQGLLVLYQNYSINNSRGPLMYCSPKACDAMIYQCCTALVQGPSSWRLGQWNKLILRNDRWALTPWFYNWCLLRDKFKGEIVLPVNFQHPYWIMKWQTKNSKHRGKGVICELF